LILDFRASSRAGVDRPNPHVMAGLPLELPFAAGQRVLDLGCGAGLYSLLAAKAGATVLATDVVDAALEATRVHAESNDVADLIETRRSDLFSGLQPGETFDVIVANMPQTPCPDELARTPKFTGTKWGGPDGRRLLDRVWRDGRPLLRPGGGIFTLQIGWLDWRAIDRLVDDLGYAGETLGSGLRPFTWAEYDGYAPGLAADYERRIAAGVAEAPVRAPLAFPFRWHWAAVR
jgi:methylase of polypeptide subunit release factors